MPRLQSCSLIHSIPGNGLVDNEVTAMFKLCVLRVASLAVCCVDCLVLVTQLLA